MLRMHARNLYVGTTAERTTLAALLPSDGIGAVYYDTDDGIMYYWDGTAWSTDYQDMTPYLKKVEDLTTDVRLGGSTDANMLYLDVSTNRVGIGIDTPPGRFSIKALAENDLPPYSAEFLDADDWTSVDWTGDWASGFDHTTGNTTALSQAHAAVVGTKYQIAYTVTGRTAGSFTISFGGQSLAGISATGSFGPTATSTGNLVITPLSTFDGTIVISIKSITDEVTPTLSIINSAGTEVFEIRSTEIASNTFFGRAAGAYNTLGYNNVAIGDVASYNNTTGYFNTAVGSRALFDNTVGYTNIAVGAYAMNRNTIGHENVAIGYVALIDNIIGNGNIAIGPQSLYKSKNGNMNVAVGQQAAYNSVGNGNVGIGYRSLFSKYTGTYNVGVGYSTLYNLLATGGAITAFSDYGATVVGTVKVTSAGHGLPAGTTANIVIADTIYYDGNYTVTYIDVDNFYLTAAWVATSTGRWGINTEANLNTAIGANAGYTITTGATNIFIGSYAGYHASQLATASNSIAIGYNAYTTLSNQCVLGNSLIVQTILHGATTVTGHSDAVQLTVLANATQTANLQEWKNSASTVIGSINSAGLLSLGLATDTTPRLTLYGGKYGSDFLTLVRTEGATLSFGFSLASGGLSFHDITNSVYPFTLVGAAATGTVFIGQNGKIAGTPITSILRGENLSSGWGTNINAAELRIMGGGGTGSGTGGDIVFQTSNAGASGTTAHSFTTKLTIKGTSGSLALSEGANFWFGTTTGTKIGANANMKLAFWSATPIVQPTGATQVAPAAYATGAYGLDSDANMQALYDLVVAMRTVLVNTGLMKGSA
jgi:hypothetical protein